jgi:hypothetical protein
MSMTKTKNGANFTAIDLGSLAQLDQYKFKHPALPRETDGKLFLHQLLGLTSSEISMNKLPVPAPMKTRRSQMVSAFKKGLVGWLRSLPN